MGNEKLITALTAAFTGYEKNDRTLLDDMLESDFVFEMSDSISYGGIYVGKEEFRAYWRAVAKEWTYFRYEAREIIDAGDTVIVPVQTDGLSVRGIVMRNEHLFLFKVLEGRPISCRLYADTARGRDVLSGVEPRRFPRPDLIFTEDVKPEATNVFAQ